MIADAADAADDGDVVDAVAVPTAATFVIADADAVIWHMTLYHANQYM